MDLGKKIKETRLEKGISLRRLAKEIGVSPSFISQVEQGKAQPSVNSLKAISNILQVTCSYLIGEVDLNIDPSFSKSIKKNRIDESVLTKVHVKKLVPNNIENNLEPSLLTLEAGAGTIETVVKDDGEEFVLLLSGQLEINLNGKAYTMREGDNIYFNSSVKHSFRNNSDKTTKLLWVKAS